MSEKNKSKTIPNSQRWMPAAVVISLIALCVLVAWLLTDPQPKPDQDSQPTSVTQHTGQSSIENQSTKPVQMENLEQVSIALEHGLQITDVGKYTGVYMEDGSDEIVSGIMMIAVTNTGEADIQYAEITMPVGEDTAKFVLSTLPVGKTVILLEQNRMEYVPGEYTAASASNVALFQAPLSLCEDRLAIQILDGAINVTNISGADLDGDIFIYYKNSASDVYYGGITYRVRLEGGMKADEIRQIMASHFSAAGSSIMFVTCGEG